MSGLAADGVAICALVPVIGSVGLQNAEIVSSKLAVLSSADRALRLFSAGGCSAAVSGLAADGIAVYTLVPVIGSVGLQNAVVVSSKLAVGNTADFTDSFRRAGRRSAAVLRLFKLVAAADGAFFPVIFFVSRPYGCRHMSGLLYDRSFLKESVAAGAILVARVTFFKMCSFLLVFQICSTDMVRRVFLTIGCTADFADRLCCAGGSSTIMRNFFSNSTTIIRTLKPMIIRICIRYVEIMRNCIHIIIFVFVVTSNA